MKLYTNKFILFFALLFLFSCGLQTENWTIGIEKNLLEYQASEKNVYLEGFLQDLFSLMAKGKNLSLKVMKMEKMHLVALLEQGKIDAMVTNIAKNPVSEKSYTFSSPLLELGLYLVVADKTLFSEKYFSNKIIGFVGSQHYPLLSRLYPDAILRPYASYTALFADLHKNVLDAVCAKKVIASAYINEFYTQALFFMPQSLEEEALRFVVKKEKEDTVLFSLSQSLKTMSNKDKENLEKKWSLTLR